MKLLSSLRLICQSAMVVLTAVTFVGCAHASSPTAMNPKHVLVVTTTTGFRHSSIPTAEKIIGELAQSNGAFTIEYARVEPGDPQFKGADGKPDKAKVNDAIKAVLAEKMSAAALAKYDGVIFANTTGDLPLPDPQAFLDWIKTGKGFIGMHAATDTFPGFQPYTEMIGGHFLRHGPQVQVDVLNQDAECPACRHLPATWTVFDEIYQLKDFDRSKVHGVLSLDRLMLNAEDIKNGKATPGDYPIAWRKDYGRGRVFYTSLGHREDIWDANWTEKDGRRKNSPEVARQYQQHILGGIRWALGLEK
jgi:type 1 glutamine amidotransferase